MGRRAASFWAEQNLQMSLDHCLAERWASLNLCIQGPLYLRSQFPWEISLPLCTSAQLLLTVQEVLLLPDGSVLHWNSEQRSQKPEIIAHCNVKLQKKTQTNQQGKVLAPKWQSSHLSSWVQANSRSQPNSAVHGEPCAVTATSSPEIAVVWRVAGIERHNSNDSRLPMLKANLWSRS